MSKIVQLQAENVKRLRAVTIKPDGALVIVGGDNGQGKTSTLDAIAMALGGKDLMPAEPLRRGAEKGQVVVELDDGLVVRRTFTPGGGGALTVASKEGARYPSPQKVLDGLVGRLSFDPLAFSRMEPRVQAQTLRELVGLDFSDLDAKRKGAFEQRTDINRESKRLEGALAKLPPAAEGAPAVEMSVDELAAELERRRAHNAGVAQEQRKLESMRAGAVALKERAKKLADEISAVQAELAETNHQIEEATSAGKAQAEKVHGMQEANEAEVLEQLKSIQATNAAARAGAERRRLEAELEAEQAKAFDLTGIIQKIDDEKREKLAAAKFPIDGLAFDEAGVTLNGLPLGQASSAEQLRASVAIGLAMHPKLKVLLVRDGSLLDEKSLALVADMAAKAEAQVWVERVGKGDECAVVIEDGQVVEQPAAAEPPGKGKKSKDEQAALRLGPGANG